MDKFKTLILLVIMIFFSKNMTNAKVTGSFPDFDYPQTVSAEALKDIKKAMRNGDGELAVDALVRFAIAKSSVTDEAMDTIINQIETVKAREKREDIKSLLNYFEALVFQSYQENYSFADHENALDDVLPQDYSEWSKKQFIHKINTLVRDALSNPDALKICPITNYSKIIELDDEYGGLYCPNLLTFMAEKCRILVSDAPTLVDLCWQLQLEGAGTTVEATIYNRYQYAKAHGSYDRVLAELYQEYKDNEHSGLILSGIASIREYYNLQREYITNFPNGAYSLDVRKNISAIEEKRASANFGGEVYSTDSIKVSGRVYNINDLTVTLYHIPDKLFQNNKNSYLEFDLSELEVVETKEVHINGTIPFDDTYEAEFSPQTYGRYIILTSYDNNGTILRNEKANFNNSFYVTDLICFQSLSQLEKLTEDVYNVSDSRIIVVDRKTGKPQSGVDIYMNNVSDEFKHGVTDANGSFSLPHNLLFNRIDFTYERGNDKYNTDYNAIYPYNQRVAGTTKAKVFTDLAIYRPGETLRFAIVLYNNSLEGRNIVAGERLSVVFRDANNQRLDTVTVTTDKFGRAEGCFSIPTDRMNGSFGIDVYYGEQDRYRAASHYVEVSEYKAPTFIVSLDDTRSVFLKDQPVKIEGRVETYSGLPLANNEVQLILNRNEWSWDWYWFRGRNHGAEILDTTVKTDAEGKFVLVVENDKFEEYSYSQKYFYSRYNYSVNATCTNVAGETQEANATFIIGGRRGISFANHNYNNIYKNDKPINLPLEFHSTDENEKSVMCYYRVTKDNDTETNLLTGVLDTNDPTIDLTSLQSGSYKIYANILGEAEDSNNKDYYYLTLYRLTDKEPPVENTPLWTPEDARYVDSKNVAHFPIGVSVDNAYIYYMACSRDKVISQGWLNYKKGYHDLTFQIPNVAEEYVRVVLVSYHSGELYQSVHTFVTNVKRQLSIKVESFRDKLVPGERETWQFKLVNVDDTPFYGAMLLEMIDKAINDLQNNTWSFNVWRMTLDRGNLSVTFPGKNEYTYWSYADKVSGKSISYDFPSLNLYDSYLFSNGYGYAYALDAAVGGSVPNMYMRMGARLEEGVPEFAMAKEEAAIAEISDEDSGQENAVVDEDKLGSVTLREDEVKVALWQPMLTSDKDGVVKVEFDAPQYNTTWLMQAVAYNAELYIGSLNKTVITQKPIMVKSGVPRFLRQGDKASLAATLQNATEEQQSVDAVIELFDPRTGNIVARRTYKETLEPKGTQALMIDWSVPDSIAFVGFRVKAANTDFGDGEQVMIPVLQSISPVIETKPFYIDAATPTFTMSLPQFPLDARVTLEYCDNPVWYCATALPTIYDDNNDIATSLVHSLYAVTVAHGIAEANPQIKEAVNYWTENNDTDSTLVSMLQKNSDLKIGSLIASPWVREADRQTLRMSRLAELMDDSYSLSEIQRVVKRLGEIQMNDGGWPWFVYPGCKSSLYTTATVLEIVGELQHLGYLADNAELNAMMQRALTYYDGEELKLFKEQTKRDKKNYSGFSTYVYIHSLYPTFNLSRENSDMLKKCISAMKKDWKGTTIANKAFYAITLKRNGETSVARQIVESIRQNAMVKPELGMYWDNLNRGWNYYDDKVAVTAVVLQAMNEVDPRLAELDQIRKWMLLMKQTNDWGSSSLAADAVYSILSCGSQWLERNETPDITIDGTLLAVDSRDAYLGYFRKEIAAASGANLVINRSGNSPAWGAVYSQFHAPMTDIEAVAIDELSIRKEIHVYAADGSLKPATTDCQVGDKVQIRVVIKNNRDLDFVTVKDERGSCFEPKDKVSGYRYADGSYYYLEVKDSETNLFFSSLLKGTHVISYDAYVTASGEYNVGIATAQCQYAPQITAHSAGVAVTVK